MKKWILVTIALLLLSYLVIREVRLEPFQANSTANCQIIANQQATVKAALAEMRAAVQDVSGSGWTAIGVHDENFRYQYQYMDACSKNPISDYCKQLARSDELLMPGINPLNAMNGAEVYYQSDFQAQLDQLNQTARVLNCTATTDPELLSYSPMNALGHTEPDALSEKLKRLSPYYVSPAIVADVSQILLGSNFNQVASDIAGQLRFSKQNIDSVTGITCGVYKPSDKTCGA